MKKFKKLKNKIQGLSFKLDKNNTKLSDLDELNSVIDNFKKQTDSKYKVDVDIDLLEGSVEVRRIRKPYLKLVK